MKISIAAFLVFICAATETAGVEKNFCGKYWRVQDGICHHTYLTYTTLPGVKRVCERWNSKVVAIKSAQQLNLVQTMAKKRIFVWVDLYRRTEVASPGWYWGDGTPFVPTVLKWNKGLESVSYASTVGLTTQGTLVPINTWGAKGYICEIKPTDKKCPKDFILKGNTCFFLSDLAHIETLTYSSYTASRACSWKAKGSKLLEIRSKEKMRAVTSLIKVKSPFVWYIGLMKKKNDWKWKSDSSYAGSVTTAPYMLALNYCKWANENDNLGGQENCAIMFVKTGRLKDVQCRVTRSSGICTKPDTVPMFSPFTGKFGCGLAGWVRGGMSCYLLFEKLQTWSDARGACKKSGGELMKIDSSIETNWIKNFLWYGPAWTGLCYENGGWRWRDKKLLDKEAIEWDAEPSATAGRACAVINVKGEFVARSCRMNYRYVCELPEKDEAKCPENWSYFNQSCYILINNRTTWRDAILHCQILADYGHYSYVFYPRYVGEIDYVVKTFLPKIVQTKEEGKSPVYIWTLLTDDNTGVWGYLYKGHQPVNMRHVNWRKSPSKEATKTDGSYCATYAFGFLVDQPKTVTRMAICERPLGPGSKTAGQTSGEVSLLVAGWWVIAACSVMATRWAH